MKLVSFAPSNRVSGHSPTVLSRRAGASTGNKNGKLVLSRGNKHYLGIRIRPGSRLFRGSNAKHLSFHLVFASGRYYIELHYKNVRLDGRPTTAAIADPTTLQAVVTKFNANATFSKWFIAELINNGDGVAFDGDFDGTGTSFPGGRGRGK